jgi:murein L,D-transpeptidase YcbB/YkuD
VGNRLPLLLILLAAGCGGGARLAAVTEAIQNVVAAAPAPPRRPVIQRDLRAFYTARASAPAWVDGDGPTNLGRAAMDVLRGAADHGLAPQNYGEPDLARDLDTLSKESEDDDLPFAQRARDLARFDVRLTSALLTLGRDVAVGRAAVEPGKKGGSRRAAPDVAGALQRVADEGNLDEWLTSMQPVHPQYAALLKALAGARQDPAATALIAANLERWRAVPDDLGARHFLINIPEYRLYAREQGRTALEMKVIVGKPENRTPVFSDEMETVVFSPYWNIPDTIVAGETAPAVARDPRYLERQQIEIVRSTKNGVTRVDPSDVDWDDPAELKQLAFRQRPGAHNALGHVKFLFPNDYDVYLHDTPSDELFARSGRAFSHGCVRVEAPDALAEYVLRDMPEWTGDAIRQAMHSGIEKHVKLRQTIPVHIVYFTAGVDAEGRLQAWKDIYGLDTQR